MAMMEMHSVQFTAQESNMGLNLLQMIQLAVESIFTTIRLFSPEMEQI